MTPAEVRDCLGALASRAWPIERLFAIWQHRRAGLSIEQIAAREGTEPGHIKEGVHRLIEAGLLIARSSGWTPAVLERFKTLWDDAVPIPDIALRLGMTPNAIIGKSHRLIASGVIAARPLQPRQAREVSPDEKAQRYQKRLAEQKIRRRAKAVDRPARRAELSDAAIAQRRAAAAARWGTEGQNRGEQIRPDSAYREPTRAAPVKRQAAPEQQPSVPPPTYGRIVECCWPLGEPGTPSFRFCDKPSDRGRPYCHTHARKAYVSVPNNERREARA